MADLYTIRDIANKLGMAFPEVEKMIRENGLEPVERKGLLRYFDKDAVDLLEGEMSK